MLDVIKTYLQINGIEIKYSLDARWEGDPARLVSGSTLAKEVLGWRPEFGTINTIIESAWKWYGESIRKGLL